MSNCTFSHSDEFGIWINYVESKITNCNFYENNGSPILASFYSKIELRGKNIFESNTAQRGGALALYEESRVNFGLGSYTLLVNNTAAEFGGAIYIFAIAHSTILFENLVLDSLVKKFNNKVWFGQNHCFYTTSNNSSIKFHNNKAIRGGHDIYGAAIYDKSCDPLNNTAFKFDNESLSTYQISSGPTRVCFCENNRPECENKAYFMLHETRYPGETFTTSVILAGHNFGRVAGSVYTNVLGQDYKEVILENQHVQNVGLINCSNLTYTVLSREINNYVVLVLTPREHLIHEQHDTHIQQNRKDINECSESQVFPCTALLTTPVYINVTLEMCPLGFELDEMNRSCICDSNINITNSTCEIRNHIGYITREGTVWLGVDTSENNTNVYYWHRYCPRDYCNRSQTAINLTYPDEQCSSNRSGVLCGRCQAGCSLELGGNRCITCNNSRLALLIVFAVFGILLVVLIKILDLTVTSGTINGLIFYANVVWSNNATLFSLKDKQSAGYYIITLPIAWMNLDFGIETCFSENLDQLTKTGLQFVFPVYIWCIASFIIIISHYSTRATKLFGNNSVAVLATLFLLSYGKLFRNIADVFTFADVTDSNGTIRTVWSLDGNVQYGVTPGHIVLQMMAILFLVLFIAPFTLMFLLVPFLRAKSHLRPLHWINTLKPFFDTYFGPFKDKKQHQVWTGILLISRVMILIVTASTSTYSPNAGILAMTLISMLLLMYSAMVGLLYKKWTLSFLENIYLINLALLGGTFQFYHTLPQAIENQQLNPVAASSVVVALFSFLCTVIIYTAKRIYMRKRSFLHSEEVISNEETVSESQGEGNAPTVQIVDLKRFDSSMFRETLLELLP